VHGLLTVMFFFFHKRALQVVTSCLPRSRIDNVVGDENVYEMRIANDNWNLSPVVVDVKLAVLSILCLALSVSQWKLYTFSER
jgi:hypothetical protein